ncbi:hypothetical protein [Lacinutrix salivirga]
MKLFCKTSYLILFILSAFVLFPNICNAQKRLKPPKRDSKVKSADQFVNNTFKLYHKVFVYDSLAKANVEIPADLEDELLQSAEKDIDSLWQILPTIIEDMSSGNASIMRKAKATINLNRSKKALKYCVKTAKIYFTGEKENED